MGSWLHWRWPVLRLKPLMVAVGVWAFTYVDPLHMEEATAERATSAIMRMSSALYDSSNAVTVVLYNQSYIDADPRRRTWPVSYVEQNRLLKFIASENPLGIYIDLLYKNPHVTATESASSAVATSAGGLDYPGDLFDQLRNTYVPIFVSALPSDFTDWDCEEERAVRRDHSSIIDAIQNNPRITGEPKGGIREYENIGMVSWSGCGDRYPFMLGHTSTAATPALLFYREECERGHEFRLHAGCRKLLDGHPEPMTVRWGAYPQKSQYDYTQKYVCQGDRKETEPIDRAVMMVRQFFLSIVDGTRAAGPPNDSLPCPAFNVIHASQLMPWGAQSQALRESIHRHAVFIGADMPGIPDTVVSPVHGEVPGVFLHAMALDNLFKMNGRYVREVPPVAWALIQLAVLVAVAVCSYASFAWTRRLKPDRIYLAIYIVVWLFSTGTAFMRADLQTTIKYGIGGLLAVLFIRKHAIRGVTIFAVFCWGSVLLVQAGWAPANWIVLALGAFGVYEIVAHAREKGEWEDAHPRFPIAWKEAFLKFPRLLTYPFISIRKRFQ